MRHNDAYAIKCKIGSGNKKLNCDAHNVLRRSLLIVISDTHREKAP